MKRNIFTLKILKVFLIFCLAFAVIGTLPASSAQVEETLAVIERDTLQTRNFAPVINHEAMVVNLTGKALTVDIRSPFPAGKYIKDSSLAAFGKDSLLGAPLFSPFEAPVKEHMVLEKPALEEKGADISYYWNKVTIPAENAAIAQYDNYYGPVTAFYRPDGLDVEGLRVTGDYSVTKQDTMFRFKFVFTLKNSGTQDIDEMFFRFFLPNALALDEKGDLHTLVEPDEIWSSENLTVTISTIIDGFGNAARGIDATMEIGTLNAGAEIQGVLQIDFKKKVEEGDIFPIFNLLGRRKLTRLWPATIISGEAIKSVKSFHYLFYNLVITDSRLFKLKKDSIEVVASPPPSLIKTL